MSDTVQDQTSAPPPSPSVCVIGSGPSGFYAADAVLRKSPAARIDILDRLPTPFGLVRAGVAPDHQGSKAVTRQFDRLCAKPGLRFLGNVMVGRDVGYDELKAAYDIVIVAAGAPADRRLGIPGENLDGVYGSAAFVGWYNGHPDFRDLAPRLDGAAAAAVIGNGNVALDIARILAKTAAEMAASDLCAHAAQAIAQAPLTDIYIIGRRGPAEASFTCAELAELGQLERAEPVVEAAALAGADADEDKAKAKNLEILRDFAARPPAGKPLRIHLLFNAAPAAVIGASRAEALLLERRGQDGAPTGETLTLPVAAVITAIGYRATGFPGLPLDQGRGTVRNSGGRVEAGVYAVGWSKRGPSGTIATNRADSIAVAELALADLAAAGTIGKPGPAMLDEILAARGARAVSFADWQKINEAECAQATGGKPREKLTRIAEMLAVLG